MLNLIDQYYWYIKHIDMFRDLSEDDTQALEKITTYRQLKHEEQLSEEGVYIIKEGRFKISEKPKENDSKKNLNRTNHSDSKENTPIEPSTIEVLEKGEIIGINTDDNENINPLISIVTLTEVCVGFISIRDFMFFLKRKPHLVLDSKPKLYRQIHNLLSKSLPLFFSRRSTRQAYNILKRNSVPDIKRCNALSNYTFRSETSRLAILLQYLATPPGINGIVRVSRLSTKRISKLIGCSMETTEKSLNTFKQHKIINIRWGKIHIQDLWKLKKTADSRFKTLTIPNKDSTTPSEDLDFQDLINPQENNRIQSNSVVSTNNNLT